MYKKIQGKEENTRTFGNKQPSGIIKHCNCSCSANNGDRYCSAYGGVTICFFADRQENYG